jgi:hypothetical protein
MKKILTAVAFVACLILPRAASAQTQVYTTVSSATWCYVSVSTLTPTRVDNFAGNCEGLLAGRTDLRIVLPSATLYGGYDVMLSPQDTSSRYGEKIATTDKLELQLSSDQPYYLMGEPAATEPKVLVIQYRPNKKLLPR